MQSDKLAGHLDCINTTKGGRSGAHVCNYLCVHGEHQYGRKWELTYATPRCYRPLTVPHLRPRGCKRKGGAGLAVSTRSFPAPPREKKHRRRTICRLVSCMKKSEKQNVAFCDGMACWWPLLCFHWIIGRRGGSSVVKCDIHVFIIYTILQFSCFIFYFLSLVR